MDIPEQIMDIPEKIYSFCFKLFQFGTVERYKFIRAQTLLLNDLAGELRKVEPGYICGDDLTNLLTRHIVDFRQQ